MQLPTPANDNGPLGRIYTFEETAGKLHVSRRSLQGIIKRHPLFAKNGKVYLFSEQDIQSIWEGMRCHCDSWNVKGQTTGISVAPSESNLYSKARALTTRRAAEAIRIKREARLLEDSVYGRKASVTFFEAAVSYMAAGGSPRFLGEEVGGRWTRLMGHFERTKLLAIGQDDLEAAAQKLYPTASADTRNRQCFTPFIAVWNHAVKNNQADLRSWSRPRKAKGTVVQLRAVRAGTKPVAYQLAAQFILAMSPAPAMVMTALFYTGMRPIELFSLESEAIDIGKRWTKGAPYPVSPIYRRPDENGHRGG
jgi:hypothetical protein